MIVFTHSDTEEGYLKPNMAYFVVIDRSDSIRNKFVFEKKVLFLIRKDGMNSATDINIC
jgi:hypothetical protein